MPTKSRLEKALINAHKEGDTVAAKRLANEIKSGNFENELMSSDFSVNSALAIGGDSQAFTPEIQVSDNNRTPGDEAKGLAEVGLTALTGATGGSAGVIAGTLQGLARELLSGEFGTPEAAKRIEKSASDLAQKLTFSPRTEAGQENVEQLSELASVVGAVPPVAANVGAISQGIKSTSPLARHSLSILDEAASLAREKFSKRNQELFSRSVGADEVDKKELRQLQADELPVKMKLTQGQKTRDFDDQRFEGETAKLQDVGAPLRERFEEQNLQLQQNMDAFIDQTGGKAFDAREIGVSVDGALRKRVAKDKRNIRRLYREAEESGGMGAKADSSEIADYLNKNRAEREENGIMTKVQRQIDALEIGQGKFQDGSLSLRDLTLKESESLRRFINRNLKNADPNDARVAGELKRIIDTSTEGLGNQKYKSAREARQKLAQDFENISLMKNLTTLKRGTTERAIALEDVLRKSIVSPSTPADSVKKLNRVLNNSGDEGVQAWKDLQAGTLQYIQNEMVKNVATNQRGDRVVSAAKLDKAIRDLDRSGKLEIVFGKKGAEQLRTINDVAKTILTNPPNAVNTSNTATTMAALMDVAISGTAAVPLPIITASRMLTQSLKDRKLKNRVKEALGDTGE